MVQIRKIILGLFPILCFSLLAATNSISEKEWSEPEPKTLGLFRSTYHSCSSGDSSCLDWCPYWYSRCNSDYGACDMYRKRNNDGSSYCKVTY